MTLPSCKSERLKIFTERLGAGSAFGNKVSLHMYVTEPQIIVVEKTNRTVGCRVLPCLPCLVAVGAFDGIVVFYPALNVYRGVLVNSVSDNNCGNTCVDNKPLAH